MSTTLSHFANLTNLTYGSVVLGSTSDLKISASNKRVEGQNNSVISGNVSSHIVDRNRSWSFMTEDISGLNSILTLTGPETLTATWVPSATQTGTPLPAQTISLTMCVVDAMPISPETKALGKYTVTGHCLATSDDSDQLSIT